MKDDGWHATEMGGAVVQHETQAWRLLNPANADSNYVNAQISDYPPFRWRPPLRLTVTAQASSTILRGTAGFGFWNHPFSPVGWSLRLPQAIWFFFGSPPNNMALAQGVLGYGWKAATISANRWPFALLLPTAPFGFLLMRIPSLYRVLWPLAQRAIGVSEKALDAALFTERHTYSLEWHVNRAVWMVDGVTVHESAQSPRGPLGLVLWIDNQYAIVTPQGHFGYGVIPIEQEQWLRIAHIHVDSL